MSQEFARWGQAMASSHPHSTRRCPWNLFKQLWVLPMYGRDKGLFNKMYMRSLVWSDLLHLDQLVKTKWSHSCRSSSPPS
jgi:hypothetical protein